jgi:hypothetical protein
VTVLLPHREGSEQELASARLVDGRNCRAVELSGARSRRLVLLRDIDARGAMEAAGVRSDAELCAVGFDSEGKRSGALEAR